MKKCLFALLAALALSLLGASSAVAQSTTTADLQGKWTLKKNSDRWGEVTQTLELKDDAFTYRVQSKQGDSLLFAKGKVKVEKVGAFKVLKLTGIEGGYSEGNLEATNDDRDVLFVRGWNTLTLGLNFDRERDGEQAEADTYTKAKN